MGQLIKSKNRTCRQINGGAVGISNEQRRRIIERQSQITGPVIRAVAAEQKSRLLKMFPSGSSNMVTKRSIANL
jgi:hypothetical protein